MKNLRAEVATLPVFAFLGQHSYWITHTNNVVES